VTGNVIKKQLTFRTGTDYSTK